MSTHPRSFVHARLVASLALLALAACDSSAPADDEMTAGPVADAGKARRDAGRDARAAVEADDESATATGRTDAATRDASHPRDAGAAPSVEPPKVQDAGAPHDAGGQPALAGDAGSVSGVAPDELEMLRQVCVDEINMYRATLKLAPLKRATPAQELCSDRGSKKDGDSKTAHGSAGSGNPCSTGMGFNSFPGFGAQDTCPGWPVGKFGAAGTIADALKMCLGQMWAEGIPTEGVDMCLAEYFKGDIACFEAHGHYINMSNAKSKVVSCGFYNMGNNTYWMNQDFQ